jgi:pimeloyl-ACP methyl ester carboxylesterase
MNRRQRVAFSRIPPFLLAGLLLSPQGSLAQEPDLEMSEASAVVDDLEVSYRIGGSGPPLLLIHGFTFPGQQWNPFVDDLGANFTLIIPDLPGHGRSEDFPGEFRYRDSARLLFGLLDRLGIQQVSAVGHSAGASILIHMATQQPNRIDGMVLVAGGHRVSEQGRESIGQLQLGDMPENIREFYRRHHPGGDVQAEALFERLRRLAGNFADFDFSPESLATIGAKTLLVWGDRDAAYPVSMAVELYEAIPQASLWVVPGQGHYPVWAWLGGSSEAESIFASTVYGFLTR